MIAQTFELITQNFDMIAVSYFLGPESTGIYFAALKTIALLAFVNFAVGAASANQIASLHAAGQTEEMRNALDGAINLAFWPTIFGAVILVALAPMLLSLFGKDFAAHGLSDGGVGNRLCRKKLGRACRTLSQCTRISEAVCSNPTGFGCCNILLNIALIPVLGLLGAAIATSVSLIVLAVSLFFISHRRLGVVLRPTIPMTSLRKLVGLLGAAR